LTASYLTVFKEAFDKFILSLKDSSLIYNKWKADTLRVDNPMFKDQLTPIFNLRNSSMQASLITLVKLQKIYACLMEMTEIIKKEILTQYSFSAVIDVIMVVIGETMMYEIYVRIILFLADFLMTLSDFTRAIRLYQIIRVISDFFGDLQSQQTAFSYLGECFKIIGDYLKAMHYYELYLHNSWFLGDIKSELKAYDKLGMLYYYQNDMEKAQRYHIRSLCPDSALENPIFSNIIKSRLTEETNRKSYLMEKKDLYFKFEIAKDLLLHKGDIDEFLKMRSMTQYLSSAFVVDILSVIGPIKSNPSNGSDKHASQAIKIISSKKQSYKADFTPEGFTRSMQLSNPAKYTMIREGTMKLDDENTKNINLYDNMYTAVDDQKLMSHLSNNNTKIVYSKTIQESEVCLQFLKSHSKSKMRAKLDSMADEILELIEFLVNKTSGRGRNTYGSK
jgi:tetratricopeptide (TPR) repeat protein